jgi:hypothetical protein
MWGIQTDIRRNVNIGTLFERGLESLGTPAPPEVLAIFDAEEAALAQDLGDNRE